MTNQSTQRIGEFVVSMQVALRTNSDRGMTPPVERRKLRTVASSCGQRASAQLLAAIQESLNRAGIHTEPMLSDSGLRLDDWVLFSTGPFPADAAFFRREDDLRSFVEACLGAGVFRNLELCKRIGRQSGREFRLPSDNRIDLLCQERTKAGAGALVAIEFKRDHERGTVHQIIEYIDELRGMFPARHVRGLIVSGHEDRVGAALASSAGYDIEWFRYFVRFDRIAISSHTSLGHDLQPAAVVAS